MKMALHTHNYFKKKCLSNSLYEKLENKVSLKQM